MVYKNLFFKSDILEPSADGWNLFDDIGENSERYIEIIEQREPPEVSISKKCNRPYTCPLKDKCRGNLPEYHVLQLTNWRKYWELFEDGILDIKDIPKDEILSSYPG